MRGILGAAVFALLLPTACGEGVGAECGTPGSTDECSGDDICTPSNLEVVEQTPPEEDICLVYSVCLRTCTVSDDCGDGELCLPVFGATELSTCQVAGGFGLPDACRAGFQLQ